MTNTKLLAGLFTLGACLWLSGRAVDSDPRPAVVSILMVLVFSAFAARPKPN